MTIRIKKNVSNAKILAILGRFRGHPSIRDMCRPGVFTYVS